MPDAPPIRSVIGLPPDDTVRAFKARDQLRATVHWSAMWQEDHARAFTVAKVANLDLLAEIQASMADVLANGGTFEQWQANLVPHLRTAGWYGDVADHALTGTDEVVHVGARRLRTIYDTNLRVSRAAGRWKRIQELKDVRPFLRYTAVLDSRTRPEHRRWYGTILPVDHPWWDTHFPPCGWFCRCTVRQLSQRELDAKGWKVSSVPDDGSPVPFKPAGRDTIVQVPRGISPGFAYNPGKASMAAIVEKAVGSLDAMAAVDLAAARSTLADLVRSDAFAEALTEPGGSFPVMVLSPELRSEIGAGSHVAIVPAATYGRPAGLTLANYRQLPEIGAGPAEVYRNGQDVFLVSDTQDGRRYVATLRAGSAGGPLSLVAYRFMEADGVANFVAGAARVWS